MTTAFGPNFDATALAKLAPELSDVFTAAGFTTDGLSLIHISEPTRPY